MPDEILVDQRLPPPVRDPTGQPADAGVWSVNEVVIDPLWHGGLIQLGGHTVPVLGVRSPQGVWTHYALSPDSLRALAKWCTDVVAPLSPSPANGSANRAGV